MEQATFGSISYFQTADYALFGVMMGISLAIGLYYGLSGGRQRTSAEYILADRSMTFVPVTLSLLSSYFSGISMQGIPADVYYHGSLVIWIFVSVLIGGILALTFFMPMYYRLGLTSVYEYLGMRFNHVVKLCGVFSFLIFAFLYMGVVAYTACVAATAVTDISLEVALISVTVICAIYTVIGGIKAVLWTDSLQMCLMIATILSVIIKGSIELGVGQIWETASKGRRTNFFEFHFDLTEFYNGWGFVLGQITFVNTLVNTQYMVQRMVVCKSEAVARASIIGYLIGACIFQGLVVFAGLTIYAYYEGCDPGTLGYTTRNDQILPYFVIDVFRHSPGIPGLLLSGLFGAALSTLSSVLNATATLIGEHFVKPLVKGMKDSMYTVTLKIIVVISSCVTLGIAFLVPVLGDAIPVVLSIPGASQGTLLALFILGAFCPFCSSKGAVAGYVVGLVFGSIMSVGTIVYSKPSQNLPLSAEMCLNESFMLYNDTMVTTAVTTHDVTLWNETQIPLADTTEAGDIYRPVIFTVSKVWIGFITFATSMIVAVITTLVTGVNDTSKMDPRLVVWKINSSYQTVQEEEDTDQCSDKDNRDRQEEKFHFKSEKQQETLSGNCTLRNQQMTTV
ncbi:sodium-coupled monocarboxylate transporter 1-like [Asterias rubens]|uniref:sodium-coupled monocarboxylate transporter 1-like n=1 Tax=Asterias rubens TaxID=7604 RepID=UPI001454FDDE|nr:sodium-coupled monocarboxylate transporter 1-like [Asterias rubens]